MHFQSNPPALALTQLSFYEKLQRNHAELIKDEFTNYYGLVDCRCDESDQGIVDAVFTEVRFVVH